MTGRNRINSAGIFILIGLIAVTFAGLPGNAAPRKAPDPVSEGMIAAIIDGDTVILENGSEVRLVGIQAPKLRLGRRGFKPWPLADQAKQFLTALTKGKSATLRYGGTKIDRHRRLLAHLFLEDGHWVQQEVLKAGMARVYSFPDNRSRVDELLAAEQRARRAKKGIWAHPYYRIRSPENLKRDLGSFQVIEGSPKNVAIVRGRAYFNFGDNWRKDFTITISPRDARRFWRDKDIVAMYGKERLRVRGWLKEFNGPQIEATHPEQIEVLK